MTFEIVGMPDEVGEEESVDGGKPVVLFSVATDMVKEYDEEMLTDADGSPDDVLDVTLALAVGSPDAEGDDVIDTEEVPVAVIFEELAGDPEGDPLDEVLLYENVGNPDMLEVIGPAEELLLTDIVGSPDEAEVAGNERDELLNETVGNPEEAVKLWIPVRSETVSVPKGGTEPVEPLVVRVGTLDGAEPVESPVNELFEDSTGDPEAVIDVVGVINGPDVLANPVDELLKESVGDPDAVEEILLSRNSASDIGTEHRPLT